MLGNSRVEASALFSSLLTEVNNSYLTAITPNLQRPVSVYIIFGLLPLPGTAVVGLFSLSK